LARARNTAIDNCRTEFIAFIDDDAVPAPEWLARILEGFDTFGTRAACVGGKVQLCFDSDRPAWLSESMMTLLSGVDWGGELRVANTKEWVAGTNVSFRTDLLREVGYFRMYLGRVGAGASLLSNEETDMVGRLREVGGQVLYAPQALVRHNVSGERLTRTWLRRRVAWQAASDLLSNPALTATKAASAWSFVVEYLGTLPPRYRSFRGLFLPTEDPEQFRLQLEATYTMTVNLLMGYEWDAA
jgi:GT2 family glycosyltransferase